MNNIKKSHFQGGAKKNSEEKKALGGVKTSLQGKSDLIPFFRE